VLSVLDGAKCVDQAQVEFEKAARNCQRLAALAMFYLDAGRMRLMMLLPRLRLSMKVDPLSMLCVNIGDRSKYPEDLKLI
jgi:hypothetical protein